LNVRRFDLLAQIFIHKIMLGTADDTPISLIPPRALPQYCFLTRSMRRKKNLVNHGFLLFR